MLLQAFLFHIFTSIKKESCKLSDIFKNICWKLSTHVTPSKSPSKFNIMWHDGILICVSTTSCSAPAVFVWWGRLTRYFAIFCANKTEPCAILQVVCSVNNKLHEQLSIIVLSQDNVQKKQALIGLKFYVIVRWKRQVF